MAICKLCLEDKTLINKSHIIPEFMYRELYDENHKMYTFNPHERLKGEGYVKRPSSGEYEGDLLCSNCDGRVIGLYESYASKALYGGLNPDLSPKIQKYQANDGSQFSICENIQYKNFKLFLLSILWRASISTRANFTEIALGPHEEIIRQMLLAGNPGEVNDYPVLLITFANDKAIPINMVAHPISRRTRDGHKVSLFIIGGMIYVYYINSKNHKLPEYVLRQTIKPSNDVFVMHIPEGQGWEIIFAYYGIKKAKDDRNSLFV